MDQPRHEMQPHPENPAEPTQPMAEGVEKTEEPPAPSFISKLFPPPPTLIKETLSRYKAAEEGTAIEAKPAIPDEEEPPISEPKKSDDETKLDE
jgi:hypothetical protein